MRLRYIYRSTPIVLVVLTIINAIMAIDIYQSAKSPVDYHLQIVQPLQTNLCIHAMQSDLSPLPGDVIVTNAVDISAAVASGEYHIYNASYTTFISEGRSGMRLNGRYYYIGSRCAYGVICDIYPEIVYLDCGEIRNSANVLREDNNGLYTNNS